MEKQNDQSRMDRIVSLAKRRGFIFQSSEIYGGLNGFWDYGPLGVGNYSLGSPCSISRKSTAWIVKSA